MSHEQIITLAATANNLRAERRRFQLNMRTNGTLALEVFLER